ncbi:MAG: DUF1700 domain-containing protein [Lachnospiraceae bacterium]|nr:DUF1700 domain-containing protein [Lachnospiraceae bacterium]
MNREEFMRQLERLLWDIPVNDRQDAIAYYNDYFDEAGKENEASVIQKLGSPGKVAAIIKADLKENGNEQAEYTEQGYSDRRGSVNLNTPTRRETGYREPKQKRRIPLALIIVLLVFASPLLLGVGGGLLGGILGLLGALAGIILAVVAGGAACLVCGTVGLIYGIFKLAFSPMHGLLYVGVSGLSLALGILLLVLFVWCAFRWLPALFRGIVNLCQRLIHRGEERSKL